MHPVYVLLAECPVLHSSVDGPSQGGDDPESSPLSHYHRHRLEMGIAEGIEEIPPGQLLPFELNIDYLQGGMNTAVHHCVNALNLLLFDIVSYTKGCYLGQELTARTHYTGVVRRRTVPLLLNDRSLMCTDSVN